MPSDNNETIKITLDDLANVPAQGELTPAAAATATGARNYGTIGTGEESPAALGEERGSILLQGWFYLGVAGFVGALAGWAICEPAFSDAPNGHRWGNIWLLPMVITLVCVACAISESIVERSARKALIRSALSLPLGVVLGFVFSFFANIIFNIGISICVSAGVQTFRHPAFWIVRGFAWMIFGGAAGVVYGILGQSSRKALYGALGGVIGAGIGGAIFDPIGMAFHGGGTSRAVGLSLLGMAAGIGMGLVESALKDRWLYVTAGPLAGKQFILYKSSTVLGSAQQCDIYLFKDANILPQHAVVEINGARVQLRASGPVFVGGSPVRLQVLQSGAIVQIGRYSFRYQEKHKK
ncbi:MAG TPA: FHA domain-containing protein [Terriglobales bacterium]|jgi:hypothetical protein|nr:FHA domain-containing protein [Terriglobales bacterium]